MTLCDEQYTASRLLCNLRNRHVPWPIRHIPPDTATRYCNRLMQHTIATRCCNTLLHCYCNTVLQQTAYRWQLVIVSNDTSLGPLAMAHETEHRCADLKAVLHEKREKERERKRKRRRKRKRKRERERDREGGRVRERPREMKESARARAREACGGRECARKQKRVQERDKEQE